MSRPSARSADRDQAIRQWSVDNRCDYGHTMLDLDDLTMCLAGLRDDPFTCGPGDLERIVQASASAGFRGVSLWSIYVEQVADEGRREGHRAALLAPRRAGAHGRSAVTAWPRPIGRHRRRGPAGLRAGRSKSGPRRCSPSRSTPTIARSRRRGPRLRLHVRPRRALRAAHRARVPAVVERARSAHRARHRRAGRPRQRRAGHRLVALAAPARRARPRHAASRARGPHPRAPAERRARATRRRHPRRVDEPPAPAR